MDEPLIKVENLVKLYRRASVLRGLSFEVAEGEVFGLIGADGAGKSTTLKVLAGLLRAEGRVIVAGVDVLARPEMVRSEVGYMPQGLGQNLSAELSVDENIDFFADLHGAPPGERAARKEELLAATRLERFRNRQAKNLSGGMRQKLALCATLISAPRVLILDEPTTGVDPVSRREFWTIIEQVRARGITVVLATAYMDEADRCDRVGLMLAGSLLSVGPPGELRARVPGDLVELLEAEPQTEALRILEAAGLAPESLGRAVRFLAAEPDRLRARRLLAEGGVSLGAEKLLEPSFEHAFIQATLAATGAAPRPQPGLPGLVARESAPPVSPVVVEGLVKRYGDFAAVDGVSFRVERGEIFGLLGSNGAGKTTTIKILAGLVRESAGTVRVLGHPPLKEPLRLKAQMGYVSQRFSLYRDLTVAENIALYGGMYGIKSRELPQRMAWALSLADLEGGRDVLTEELPLGMKQRLALGCAVIHGPRLLFLDEPTAGVDPLTRRAFWGLIHFLSREQGVSVLVTTHYMDEAEHCDRIGLMYAGRLVALGGPAELKERLGAERGRLVAVRCRRPAVALERLKSVAPEAYLYGRKVQFFSAEPRGDLERAAALLGADFLWGGEAEVSLDDVFVHFIRQAENARELEAA